MDDATPLEIALVDLARKAQSDPAGLAPADLAPLRELVGDGALEYVLVLCSFHCITRVADLVGAEPETPAPLRRFEAMRRIATRAVGLWLRNAGLAGHRYAKSYEQALADIRPFFEQAVGRSPAGDLEPLSTRPQLVEAVQLILEERLERSSLPTETLLRVHRIVEETLESGVEASIPDDSLVDPIEAFAALGTRYPDRATENTVNALRKAGLDDLGILDLAVAIADSNMWARFHRLLGLSPNIYYL